MQVAVIKGDWDETDSGIKELLNKNRDIEVFKMCQVVLLQETENLDAIIMTTILYY